MTIFLYADKDYYGTEQIVIEADSYDLALSKLDKTQQDKLLRKQDYVSLSSIDATNGYDLSYME